MGTHSTGTTRLRPFAWAELVLLGLAALDLSLLPWWFGGTTAGSQIAALALGAAVLAAGIQARLSLNAYRAIDLRRRLVRLPICWIALAGLALVLIQLANPAWQFHRGPAGWNLERLNAIPWLPHGVRDAPFAMFNAWRLLLIHGGLWLAVVGLWLGITRRRTARLLLTIVACNGALFALIFLLQRLTGATRMLWIWKPAASYFVGGIVYKNHAGAFFNLCLATCLGLAWWHAAEARRSGRKSHPGVLFAFFGVLIFTAEAFTYARAATALGALLLLLTGAAAIARVVLDARRRPPLPILAVCGVLGAAFLAVCVVSFDLSSVWRRFERLRGEDRLNSVTRRQLAVRATLEMGAASPVFGHGTGSFRFVFPLYQQRYPEIFVRTQGTGPRAKEARLYWEHAHNDYAELWAENGAIGLLLAAAIAACVGVACWRARVFRQPALLIILSGPLLVLLHAAVDFPLQNAAVLMSGGGILVLVLRWAHFENPAYMRPVVR